jgi:hypothetical protein
MLYLWLPWINLKGGDLMKFEEFKKDFMEEVKISSQDSGEGTCAEFVQLVSMHLAAAEVLPEVIPAFYQGVGKRNRKIRVDGYYYDEYDDSLSLVIADFVNEIDYKIGKTEIDADINQLLFFIDEIKRGELYASIEESTSCYDLSCIINNAAIIKRYRFFIFTNAELTTNMRIIADKMIGDVPVEFNVWDLQRVFQVCSSESGKEEIEIDFLKYTSRGLPFIAANQTGDNTFKSYLCIIPANVIADIYDKYGSRLLEGNVRSFLSMRGKVNKSIRSTILTQPEKFFAFNNGIAATAMDVRFVINDEGQFIIGVKDIQIINGGQTTAALSDTRYKNKQHDLKNIYVQMKLTQISHMNSDDAAKFIADISRSSNSQNKVSEADFFSNHPFHIRMEQISQQLYAPAKQGAQYETMWFYERARGQFMQSQMRKSVAEKRKFLLKCPKEQVITKTDLAKFRNSWDEQPYMVSKGAQTNFSSFAATITEKWEHKDAVFNIDYYKDTVSLAILFKFLEKFVPKQAWYEKSYRANIVAYSIALFHSLLKKQYITKELDLSIIWKKQCIPQPIIDSMIPITHYVFKSITSDKRGIQNVTQWCKQGLCWNQMKNVEIKLPRSIESVLISTDEVEHTASNGTKIQQTNNEIHSQMRVLDYSGIQWKTLQSFASRNKISISPYENSALYVAFKIPEKIPTVKQCEFLLRLLKRAEEQGFKM